MRALRKEGFEELFTQSRSLPLFGGSTFRLTFVFNEEMCTKAKAAGPTN